MQSNAPNVTTINSNQSILWFLTLTYTVIMILANWFDPRLIHIFNINTDAGTLVFPFTFLLSDLITEVYGYKFARRAVWCGFLFNAVFIIYAQIVTHLPSPSFETNNQAFDTVLAINSRIIVASAISYLFSEPLNSLIMAKLKIKLKGRYLSLRFVLSTFFAAGVDSFIFAIIAFYGSMSNLDLLFFILSMWFVKIFIEVIGLPISVTLAKKLKAIEQLDIYDRQTNFNLFNLDTTYSAADNDFLKKKAQ
jgi:uncharacterized integral membrane protein (TIGR00697 family)